MRTIYPIARIDDTDNPIDGANVRRIRIARADPPPLGAFWSVTVYDDQGFLTKNPINGYSIGDHASGLEFEGDGSRDVLLQYSTPSGRDRDIGSQYSTVGPS